MVGTTLGGWYASFWAQHMSLFAALPGWVSHYHPVFLTSMLLRFAAFFWLLPRMLLPGEARMSVVARAMLADCLAFLPRMLTRARRKR